MRPHHALLNALAALTLLACGASSDLEDEQTPGTEQEACIIASDAEWTSGDCGGAFDLCGLVACENILGDGCDCPAAGMCWNGEECVPE